MIFIVKLFIFLEDIMTKFLLALSVLLTFAACEKKEEAKKEDVKVQVEPAKEAPAAPAPAVMPAPADAANHASADPAKTENKPAN